MTPQRGTSPEGEEESERGQESERGRESERGQGRDAPLSGRRAPAEIDTSTAHPARRYDYWLGGKDNFAADRASGDAVAALFPSIRLAAIENRRFLGRAVGYLAAEAGIDQFLDVGTGIPTSGNTHEVAQRFASSARVVYVDNDPIVLAHARALLTSASPQGLTAYIDADLCDPGTILDDPTLAATLDLSRPVALLLVSVMHLVRDSQQPYAIVRRLLGALPAGSYFVLSHATADHMPTDVSTDLSAIDSRFQFRSRSEVAEFFAGCELVPPGIVSASEWRAEREPQPRPSVADVAYHAAVGRLVR